MKSIIIVLLTGFMLISANVFADDVLIDSSGNVTTGVSRSGNLEVIGSSAENGIIGKTSGTGAAGVIGENTSEGNEGRLGAFISPSYNVGVYGKSTSGYAGYFDGNTVVKGDLTIEGNIIGGGGSGDITGVTAGTGLNGGGSTGEVTLDVDFEVPGNGTANTIARSDHGHTSYSVVSHVHPGEAITTGTIDSAMLNVGTSVGTVASGNHTHPASGSYAGVAVVATSSGDYTDPVTAMDNVDTWCGGVPSPINRCVLKIMPGVYIIESSLQMQSYVDIEGSGENVTKITGAIENSDPFVITVGLVYGADNAEIRSLTIENTTVFGVQAVAIVNNNVSPKISSVTAIASGAITATGIYNNTSETIMNNVTVESVGSSLGYGLMNDNPCSIEITGSRLKGSTSSVSASPFALTLLASTKLDGIVDTPPNVVKCVGSYDESYNPLTCSGFDISLTVPANNASGVTVDSIVTINWNEAVDCATVNTTTITSDSPGWTQLTCGGTQAKFLPSGQLPLGIYSVNVTLNVKNVSGESMDSSYQFSYTTGL